MNERNQTSDTLNRPRKRGHSGLFEPDVRDVPVEVYALVDPRDCQVRYVGRSGNARARLSAHIGARGVGGCPRVREWVSELATVGLRPHLRILCVVPPGDDASDAEGQFILRYRLTHRLLNRRIPYDLKMVELYRLGPYAQSVVEQVWRDPE